MVADGQVEIFRHILLARDQIGHFDKRAIEKTIAHDADENGALSIGQFAKTIGQIVLHAAFPHRVIKLVGAIVRQGGREGQCQDQGEKYAQDTFQVKYFLSFII